MNELNSIAGIDDFAHEMKKNLEMNHALLEFVIDLARSSYPHAAVRARNLLFGLGVDYSEI